MGDGIKRSNSEDIPLWIMEVIIAEGTRSMRVYVGGSTPEETRELFDHVAEKAKLMSLK